jgi:glycosyltransferase involved in cell wall biosynthesis
MKILMISDVYFPRVNGVSTSIQTFRTELTARGHQVDLLAPAWPTGWDDDPGIHRIPSRQVPLDPEDRLMSRAVARARLHELADERYDIVHVQTPFLAHYLGVEFARRLAIPVVETYHTFFEEYLFHYVPFVPKAAMRALARAVSRSQAAQVDRLIVPSSAMREVLRHYGVATPMEILPTGIPIATLAGGDGARFRSQHGFSSRDRILLFVGRVAHEKNIDFLLQAFQRASRESASLRLVIAGEGPALPGLRNLARKLGIDERVCFVGYLDRNGPLQDCYRAADAFVFASRTETQGLVLLEAMALGVPVIALSVMGTKDILEGNAGALTPEDSVDAFAQAMRQVAEDTDLRRTLAAAGRLAAEDWRAEPLATRLLTLYEDVCNRRRAR